MTVRHYNWIQSVLLRGLGIGLGMAIGIGGVLSLSPRRAADQQPDLRQTVDDNPVEHMRALVRGESGLGCTLQSPNWLWLPQLVPQAIVTGRAGQVRLGMPAAAVTASTTR